MEAAYTSTKSLNESNRLNVLQLQTRLLKAQQELSSGRLADVGVTLGARTRETVSIRQQFARFTTLIETNSIVTTRIDTTQSALSGIVEMAQSFVGSVTAARSAENGGTIAQQQAEVGLKALIDGLNSGVGGEFLFGGINTTVQPIADYYSTPTSAGKTAVDAAFMTAFGTTQSDPANLGITSAAMQTFLDGAFTTLFEEPDWSANWSDASDQPMTSRIASLEDVESSLSANESAFRKLARAYTMVADLGVENLNKGTFDLVADNAARLASDALQELSVLQGRLGTSSARIAAANEKMSIQMNILNTQIDDLERVDPFEASTRVTTLLTQLETSYSLTARVQRLTILNYL